MIDVSEPSFNVQISLTMAVGRAAYSCHNACTVDLNIYGNKQVITEARPPNHALPLSLIMLCVYECACHTKAT